MICRLFLEILKVPWNNFIFLSSFVLKNFTIYYCKHAGKNQGFFDFYNAWVLQKRGKNIILSTSPDKDKANTKKE